MIQRTSPTCFARRMTACWPSVGGMAGTPATLSTILGRPSAWSSAIRLLSSPAVMLTSSQSESFIMDWSTVSGAHPNMAALSVVQPLLSEERPMVMGRKPGMGRIAVRHTRCDSSVAPLSGTKDRPSMVWVTPETTAAILSEEGRGVIGSIVPAGVECKPHASVRTEPPGVARRGGPRPPPAPTPRLVRCAGGSLRSAPASGRAWPAGSIDPGRERLASLLAGWWRRPREDSDPRRSLRRGGEEGGTGAARSPRFRGQMDRESYQAFQEIAYQQAGIFLRDGKEALVQARIAKRMRELGLGHEREYLDVLRAAGATEEIVRFLDAISTNYTTFFREPDHIEELVRDLGRLREGGQRSFRIWSAASSTGEEPYSI